MKIEQYKVSNIRYRDLSAWLKLAIIAGWIEAVTIIIYFFIGFFSYLLY